MFDMNKSFAPSIDERTHTLVLGSMPGVVSLNKSEYYAHPRNHFWKIIYTLFNEPYEESYEKRMAFVLSKGIGLWDVIESCEREGSLDTAIRSERPNDFKTLFKQYPNITLVVFNGAKAYDVFRKKVGFDSFPQLTFVKMGSTSPAHAVGFDKKLNEWEAILCKR